METETQANRRVLTALLVSGYVVIGGIVVCMGLVMPFLPPPSPQLSATEVARVFADNQLRIQIGSAVLIVVCTLFVAWGTGITLCIRRIESGSPVLTHLSLALVGGGYVIFVLVPMTWGALSFRADTLDPNIVQAFNDWVWFLILFTWAPLSLWMVAIAIAIFTSAADRQIWPRWLGYLNLWSAILVVPAGMIVFFRVGPFAYDGIVALWIPLVVLGTWIVVMSTISLRSLRAGMNDHPASGDQPTHTALPQPMVVR